MSSVRGDSNQFGFICHGKISCLFTDTVFITSIVTLFFQIQAERELIKWLLLPVRGTFRLLFSKIASVFETCPGASLLKSPNAHSSLRETYLLKFRKCSTTETLTECLSVSRIN